MHRFNKTLVTLATSAALVTGGVAAGPAHADSLVDIEVENVLTGNTVTLLQNVSIPVAANLCGIQANVITAATAQGQKTECKALSGAFQKAYVSD